MMTDKRDTVVELQGNVKMTLGQLQDVVRRVEAKLAADAEAAKPKPVAGVTYCQSNSGDNPYWVYTWDGQRWHETAVSDTDRLTGRGAVGIMQAWFDQGKLIPYVPKVVFKPGDWVQHAVYQWLKAHKVDRVVGGKVSVITSFGSTGLSYNSADLRFATPLEILAVTKIRPKVGLIVQRLSDSAVFRVWAVHTSKPALSLDRLDKTTDMTYPRSSVDDLTTQNYKVLSSYTMKGAV